MRKILLFLVLTVFSSMVFAQQVRLTFTGKDTENQYVQLHRVFCRNFSQSYQEVLYYPDTVLFIENVGVEDFKNPNGFTLHQNYPNSFEGITYVTLELSKPGEVFLNLMDIRGNLLEMISLPSLQSGNHQFCVHVATPGMYLLMARQNGMTSSIKMVNNGKDAVNKLEYIGSAETQSMASQTPKKLTNNLKYLFDWGDNMVYLGYAMINDTEYVSQMIQQKQFESEDIVLIFDRTKSQGQPCPDMPTVADHEGNVYNTVQIGTQCWTRENMRCTTSPSTGTDILVTSKIHDAYSYSGKTAFYPNGDSSYMAKMGLLYNWNAAVDTFNTALGETSIGHNAGDAVNVTFSENRRGICPQGWHLPSDAEWKQLTDYVSGQSMYVCGDDDKAIAKSLSSAFMWEINLYDCAIGCNLADNNTTGFSALPAGDFNSGILSGVGRNANFWSSTQSSTTFANELMLNSNFATIPDQDENMKFCGISVRCLRD